MAYSYTNEVAEKFLHQIEQGIAPFQIKTDVLNLAVPYNPVSNVKFYGFNMLNLMAEHKEDPRWCTFNQCTKNGWFVKKGARSTVLAFRQAQGKAEEYKYYHVFNAADIARIPALEKSNPVLKAKESSDIEEAAYQMIKRLNPVIVNNKATTTYDQGSNVIYMSPALYNTRLDYYADLFHQVAHWTAHKSRLNRETAKIYNIDNSAKEELRTHIACLMLAAETGIGTCPHNIGEYSPAWIEAIKNDPKEIFKACTAANQIKDYILLGPEKYAELRKSWGQQQSLQQDAAHKTPARNFSGAEIGF